MTTRVAVVVFPGTNCELDTVAAVTAAGGEAELVWHARRDLGMADAVVPSAKGSRVAAAPPR